MLNAFKDECNKMYYSANLVTNAAAEERIHGESRLEKK